MHKTLVKLKKQRTKYTGVFWLLEMKNLLILKVWLTFTPLLKKPIKFKRTKIHIWTNFDTR